MDKKFVEEFKKLVGQTVKSVAVGETDSHMLFELHVGNMTLCFEVAKPDKRFWGGRCFLMHEGSVDGAGVFACRGMGYPLPNPDAGKDGE